MLSLLVQGERASIERDVFPRLVGDGLFGHVGSGYWMDIGTPERYLEATFDILEGNVRTEVGARMGRPSCASRTASSTRAGSSRPRWSRAGCRIAAGARIGGRAVLEHGVSSARARRSRARS